MTIKYIPQVDVEYVRDSLLLSIDGEFSESYNLDEMFAINDSELTKEMSQHSSRYGRIAVWLAKAERMRSLRKQQLDVEYSMVDEIIRREYQEDNAKYTESVIRANVLLDDQYGMALTAYDAADGVVVLLKNVLNAMKMKSDMLISIGAQMRAEMSMTGMLIKDDYDTTVTNVKKILKTRLKQV